MGRKLSTDPTKNVLPREQQMRSRRLELGLDRLRFGAASLDLQRCGLDDGAAEALASALRGNSTCTTCNLEQNDITDVGASALAAALVGNTTLRSLDLRRNITGERGAKAFERTLKTSNATLTTLHVDTFNGFAYSTAPQSEFVATQEKIASMLIRNTLMQEKLPLRFPCTVATFRWVLLGATSPPALDEAAAWRVDLDELEGLDDNDSEEDMSGGGDFDEEPSRRSSSSSSSRRVCVLQRLNNNGPHFAAHFKRLIADFAGCRYRGAVREWSDAQLRASTAVPASVPTS